MKRIKVHDKYFKLYMSNQQIEESIQNVADKLNNDLKDVDTPIFLSVLNGSFMFTASLMQKIEFQCDIVFIKLASYEGTSSSGNVKQIMGLTKSVEGKTVVVVEDIVDTGGTIEISIEKTNGISEGVVVIRYSDSQNEAANIKSDLDEI